ncbi:hypothetical protein MHYP_G00103110 [Metynnis hypsauchen]
MGFLTYAKAGDSKDPKDAVPSQSCKEHLSMCTQNWTWVVHLCKTGKVFHAFVPSHFTVTECPGWISGTGLLQ